MINIQVVFTSISPFLTSFMVIQFVNPLNSIIGHLVIYFNFVGYLTWLRIATLTDYRQVVYSGSKKSSKQQRLANA